MRLGWLTTVLLVAGCDAFGGGGTKPGDDSGDTAAGVDDTGDGTGGDDTGDGSDSGDDTAGGDSGDTGGPVDTALCDETFPTDAPPGPDCLTSTLACGDEVEGTTEGGSNVMTFDNWEGWFCTPNLDRHDYDGPERVFRIFVPEATTATFSLETPCDDLDLFVFYWQDDDSCPTAGNGILECEAGDSTSDREDASVWSDVGAWYLVAVDAKDGGTANFRLSVACQE